MNVEQIQMDPAAAEVERKIRAALESYRCQHSHDSVDGSGCALVDLLSPYDTIAEGVEELDLLAEHITCELLDDGGAS